jgi:predicted lipoprotein
MILAATLAAVLLGTTAAQAPNTNDNPKSTTVTHDGCVVASPRARNTFTLDDDGQTYVLKGLDVRDLVGKRVQVGGLYPSPNVAGQGSAIDPAKAGIASQGGPTSQSARPTVEFEVKSVRVLPGTCAENDR